MSSWARAWAYEQRVGEWVEGKRGRTWRKNPGAKSVLAAICEFPDQDGRCWVGQETLACMTEQSVRTVRAHLHFLEHTAKLIRREERRRRDGTRASDYIWVLAPKHRLRPPDPQRTERPEDPAPQQPADFAADQPEGSAGSAEQPADPAPTTGRFRQNNRQVSPQQPAGFAGLYMDDPSGGSVRVDPPRDPSVGVSERNVVRTRGTPPPREEEPEGPEGNNATPSPHRERARAHASALGRKVKRRTRKVDGEEMQRYLKRFANDCMLALEDGVPERVVAAVIERIDERWEDVVLNWPAALDDVRERTEEESVNERGHSFWEAHEAGRDKPCRPEWYVAACGGAPAEYEAMIGRGMLHSEILEAAHA